MRGRNEPWLRIAGPLHESKPSLHTRILVRNGAIFSHPAHFPSTRPSEIDEFERVFFPAKNGPYRFLEKVKPAEYKYSGSRDYGIQKNPGLFEVAMVSLVPSPRNRSVFQHRNSTSTHTFPARVAIINGNRTKAELLQHWCASHLGYNVVALEQSGPAGLAAVSRTKPELLLVSIDFSHICPFGFVQNLQATVPAAKLLLFTSQCSEYLIHGLGAISYYGLVWEVETGLLLLQHVIETVRNGIRFVSTGIAKCQTYLRNSPDAFPKLLTRRQQEVLVCITHALSDEAIGLRLGCSVSTALTHRQKIMQVLNIRTTPKLIRYGTEKGFGAAQLPTPIK